VLVIKNKAGHRGFTSGEEGPEPGYMLVLPLPNLDPDPSLYSDKPSP
jgi:hypothetical protein